MEETTKVSDQESNGDAQKNGTVEEVKKEDDSNGNKEETNKLETDSQLKNDRVEPSVELLNKIKKQVEFYFGDINMQRDKFLIEQTKLDDGWVPMSVMLNFKILASLSKDVEVILKALETSDLIEISQDRKKIRRTPEKPLPMYNEEYRKSQEAKTLYLKGFPTDTTMEILKEHFECNDAVENIIMRKYKKGKEYFFKGSVFLQFKTLDDAKTFMGQESVKFKDTELIRMWSADYVASKEKEREEKRLKKSKNENDKAENKKNMKNNKNNSQEEKKFPKGCILQISNLQKDVNRDHLKEKLTELDSKVAYVDYNPGDTEGYIRLLGENSAVDVLKKLDSDTLKVNDCEVKCKLLEGDEEASYLVKIQETMANHRFNRRDKGRNNRKGFKRRHSPNRDGNAKKGRVDL